MGSSCVAPFKADNDDDIPLSPETRSFSSNFSAEMGFKIQMCAFHCLFCTLFFVSFIYNKHQLSNILTLLLTDSKEMNVAASGSLVFLYFCQHNHAQPIL